MGIIYNLELVTDLTPREVLKALFNNTDITFHPARQTGPGKDVIDATGTKGMNIAASNADEIEDALSEIFDMKPNVHISFKLVGSLEDRELEKAQLLSATFSWLSQNADDVCLLFSYETVMLIRKAGKLFLNSISGLWQPTFLEMLTIPYEMKDIPNF